MSSLLQKNPIYNGYHTTNHVKVIYPPVLEMNVGCSFCSSTDRMWHSPWSRSSTNFTYSRYWAVKQKQNKILSILVSHNFRYELWIKSCKKCGNIIVILIVHIFLEHMSNTLVTSIVWKYSEPGWVVIVVIGWSKVSQLTKMLVILKLSGHGSMGKRGIGKYP